MKKIILTVLFPLTIAACSQEATEQSMPVTASSASSAITDLTAETVPAEGFVINNAKILDGMGGIIENGSIVVQGDRIVSVNNGDSEITGALTIDAEGRTLMPGFIDAHRHIITGEDPAEWLANQAESNMQAFLEAGFTTVLSAGDAGEQVLELRRMTAENEILGPRIIAAMFTGLAAAGGPDLSLGDPARFDNARPPLRATEAMPAIPEAAVRGQVQALFDNGFDAAKNVINISPGGPEEEALGMIVEETQRLGIRTITHAVTVIDTLAAVRAGVDQLVHTPHIGLLTLEEAQQVADSNIPMTSTLGIFVPFYDENNEPIFRDALPFPWDTISSAGQGPVNARLLWEAGVVYGYGTDTTYAPSLTLKHELKSLFLVFSEQDILRIMGEYAAINVAMEDQIGTLEAGKIADIVLVDGNPEDDIFDLLNVDVVVKNGHFVVDKR
ncbi:MAG: amidohydrolase family protein [Gammaproteobacteria bacterium]|jgi:imidazolonepropionase-like amidohydrolase|nr:amidohydrolase family protein [Gammaproteobacteria bacterium]